MSITKSTFAEFSETKLGSLFLADEVTVFFGNRNSHIEELISIYPELDFFSLRQIHSPLSIKAQRKLVLNTGNSSSSATWLSWLPKALEADASWTLETQLALCVRTADCLPILFYCPSRRVVAAAHAGWRGLVNGVLQETILNLKSEGTSLSEIYAWIGPHITQQSFEIGNDVAQQLYATALRFGCHREADLLGTHIDPNKKFANLSVLAKLVLSHMGLSAENIFICDHNTFSDPNYASYRRDGANSGRQISFIALR